MTVHDQVVRAFIHGVAFGAGAVMLATGLVCAVWWWLDRRRAARTPPGDRDVPDPDVVTLVAETESYLREHEQA